MFCLFLMISVWLVSVAIWYKARWKWNGGICRDTGQPWELDHLYTYGSDSVYRSGDHWYSEDWPTDVPNGFGLTLVPFIPAAFIFLAYHLC